MNSVRVLLLAGLLLAGGAAPAQTNPAPSIDPGNVFLPDTPLESPTGAAAPQPSGASPQDAGVPADPSMPEAGPPTLQAPPIVEPPRWWQKAPVAPNPPPWRVECFAAKRDVSRIWWKPEDLALRTSAYGPKTGGTTVRWMQAPSGLPSALLMAVIPVEDDPDRRIVIRQALSMDQIGSAWVASLSPMSVELAGPGEASRELLMPHAGHGRTRLRVPSSGLWIQGWVACALDGARKDLTRAVTNEELRRLLIGAGDAIWRVAPRRG